MHPVQENVKLVVSDWETVAPIWEHLKIVNRMANNVDSDEMAHN